MCLYRSAVLSFKRSTEEGLTEAEFAVVDHWRTTLLHICTQEMVHLALVANLTTALGAGGRRYAVYDGAFSPGSLPLAEACSISALISPPIRMNRPVTYIQVSNTITAPMLP